MMSARPILNSDGEGPIRGTLLFGRFLDGRELTTLAVDMDQVYAFSDEVLVGGKGAISLQDISGTHMTGSITFLNLSGEACLTLETELTRDVFRQGVSTFRLVNGYFATIVVVLLLTLFLVFRQHLFVPVRDLMTGAIRLADGDIAHRVGHLDDDELGQLGRAFNSMADRIQSSQESLFSQVEARTVELEEANHQLQLEIQERNEVEQSLIRSEKQYRTIFFSTGTAMAILDEENTVLLANTKLAELVQLPLAKLEGNSSWQDYIVAEDLSAWTSHSRVVDFDEYSDDNVLQIRLKGAKGGLHHIHIGITRLPESNHKVASFIDITPLRESQEALIRSNQLAAVGTLASGVAHQFNNINASVLGYAELGLEDPHLSDRIRKYFDRISASAQRAKSITHNLLSFGGEHSTEMRRANINLVIQDTLSLLQEDLVQEGITTKLDLAPLEDCLLDAPRIGQVFLHILRNASQAVLDCQRKEISIESHLEGEMVHFDIRDSGCGINEEDLKMIFTPFFSTKGEHSREDSPQQRLKGVGLGLSVCATIIKQHQGHIEVKSEVGKGTVVSLALPYSVETGVHALPSPVATAAPKTRVPRVIVIEDEPDVRDLISRVLTSRGILCDVTDDGGEALHRIVTEQYGLAIVDIQMPKMDGLLFIEQLQVVEEVERPPCLIVTGKVGDTGIESLRKTPGCIGVLCKPFDIDDLYQTVSASLGLSALEEDRGEPS
jgi:PAS domain S-box-containing protein